MKPLLNNSMILVSVLMFSVLFLQCEKENSNKHLPDPNQDKKKFAGTSVTVIRYYAFNPHTGQDEFIEEKNYTYPVFVFLNPPLTKDGVTEANPFNLQIYPDRSSNPDEEGHLDISSALFIIGPSGEVLLQYWNITLVNGQIGGILTETHTAESAAANLVWAWDDIAGIIMTMPFPVATGAVMTGTLSDNSIEINITGESVSTYRKFTSSIIATRQ